METFICSLHLETNKEILKKGESLSTPCVLTQKIVYYMGEKQLMVQIQLSGKGRNYKELLDASR